MPARYPRLAFSGRMYPSLQFLGMVMTACASHETAT